MNASLWIGAVAGGAVGTTVVLRARAVPLGKATAAGIGAAVTGAIALAMGFLSLVGICLDDTGAVTGELQGRLCEGGGTSGADAVVVLFLLVPAASITAGMLLGRRGFVGWAAVAYAVGCLSIAMPAMYLNGLG
jgi:hypothetical protein